MCIAIAGGVKSLERNYKNLGKKYGIKCKLYNQKVPDLSKRIKYLDAIVIFTKTVSHKMVEICKRVCKKNDISLKILNSSSLTQLEKSIVELKECHS